MKTAVIIVVVAMLCYQGRVCSRDTYCASVTTKIGTAFQTEIQNYDIFFNDSVYCYLDNLYTRCVYVAI